MRSTCTWSTARRCPPCTPPCTCTSSTAPCTTRGSTRRRSRCVTPTSRSTSPASGRTRQTTTRTSRGFATTTGPSTPTTATRAATRTSWLTTISRAPRTTTEPTTAASPRSRLAGTPTTSSTSTRTSLLGGDGRGAGSEGRSPLLRRVAGEADPVLAGPGERRVPHLDPPARPALHRADVRVEHRAHLQAHGAEGAAQVGLDLIRELGAPGDGAHLGALLDEHGRVCTEARSRDVDEGGVGQPRVRRHRHRRTGGGRGTACSERGRRQQERTPGRPEGRPADAPRPVLRRSPAERRGRGHQSLLRRGGWSDQRAPAAASAPEDHTKERPAVLGGGVEGRGRCACAGAAVAAWVVGRSPTGTASPRHLHRLPMHRAGPGRTMGAMRRVGEVLA